MTYDYHCINIDINIYNIINEYMNVNININICVLIYVCIQSNSLKTIPAVLRIWFR